MAFKHPHKYALMGLVSEEDYKKLEVFRDKLDPLIEFYMKPYYWGDVAPQHVSLCYFSYSDKYPEDYVEKLIPKILEVAKKYLPMKVKVKGLKGGWEEGLDVPAVLWNIIDLEEIKRLHDELIERLKDYIEHFSDSEMDFNPHIGVGMGKEEKISELKSVIEESKKDKVREVVIDRLDIFFPGNPRKIFP